jgi:hypothetical protein
VLFNVEVSGTHSYRGLTKRQRTKVHYPSDVLQRRASNGGVLFVNSCIDSLNRLVSNYFTAVFCFILKFRQGAKGWAGCVHHKFALASEGITQRVLVLCCCCLPSCDISHCRFSLYRGQIIQMCCLSNEDNVLSIRIVMTLQFASAPLTVRCYQFVIQEVTRRGGCRNVSDESDRSSVTGITSDRLMTNWQRARRQKIRFCVAEENS